jgi:ATP-dependent Clp protease ATP-binding subunit ClpB
VLFDEIEKAHPKVFDSLLSILDCGEMKDNFGNLVSFKNAIIIFTTNLGYKAGFSENKGLGFVSKSTTSEDILDSVKKHFRPEFINRINDIVVFNSLTDEIGKTLVDRYVAEFSGYSGLSFNLSEDDYNEIIKDANIPEYGARGLKRCVQKHLIKMASKIVEVQ